jgi:hypothetical protein
MNKVKNPKEERENKVETKGSSFIQVVVCSQCLSHHAYLLTKSYVATKRRKRKK